ncbi:uncharacterized protein MELLADRAFT_123575 [Melampsora larici-populina 98AG31]|uniref:Secreted protein n=1 Tax=Melampsora larici-populina (strain 98AG31 / pathotype 3-4-7) TaxID=747676 RepID=F4RIB4_MELLP|nr:uncharacterized protein MELLADRAFT_123575 [Melampsora larici-populina 98AG31]EGG07994.1 secreted protein [Melampsora larici-populina 98AG31]
MLRIFIKIAFLLHSLGMHGLNAEKPLYTVDCNGGVSYYSGGLYNVECRSIINGVEKHYHCSKEDCWNDYHQWIPFTRCQLDKSPNKDFSNQQCSQYNYLGSKAKGYSCTNPGDKKYVCPNYSPDFLLALRCEHCRAGNW